MSFYPDTDRASTWVALVMIGFMAVSLLVWILGRGPNEQPSSTVPPQPPQSEAPVAEAAQPKTDAPQATQPVAPLAISQPVLSNSYAEKPSADNRSAEYAQPAQLAIRTQSNPPAASTAPLASQTTISSPTQPAPSIPAQTSVLPAAQPTPSSPTTTSSVAREAGPNPSALVRGLRSNGHRVHATVSGAGSSMTLSVTGATLTREAAVEWLGGARQELKAAGVRVVSIHSGQGSWTFML